MVKSLGRRAGAQSSIAEAAHAYIQQGLAPIPVHRGEKRPVGTGWQDKRLTEDDIAAHFSDGQNIGVLLGEPSGGLVDVDLDAEEVEALFENPRGQFAEGETGIPGDAFRT